MTYLFTAIGISVINAMVDYEMSDWHGLLVVNGIILMLAYGMEKYSPLKAMQKKMLTFTALDFEVINSNKLLLEEVRNKTNINVFKVELLKISESKHEVTVCIYFKPIDE